MSHEIICEGFQKTEAIQSHIESLILSLEELVGESESFHFYLSKQGDLSFKAGIRVRYWQKDLYAQSCHQDLYKAATMAKKCLRKQIADLHRRRCEKTAVLQEKNRTESMAG